MGKFSMSKIMPILIIVVVAASLGFFLWQNYGSRVGLPTPEETFREIGLPTIAPKGPTPTPKPTPAPLKQGKETYSISQTQGVRPRIESAEIDPQEPKVGASQKIRVKVSDTAPIKEVTISLKSDNKTTTLPPTKLVEGTNLDGIWETSWNMNDTILFTYVFTFKVQGTNIQTSLNLPIRLPKE